MIRGMVAAALVLFGSVGMPSGVPNVDRTSAASEVVYHDKGLSVVTAFGLGKGNDDTSVKNFASISAMVDNTYNNIREKCFSRNCFINPHVPRAISFFSQILNQGTLWQNIESSIRTHILKSVKYAINCAARQCISTIDNIRPKCYRLRNCFADILNGNYTGESNRRPRYGNTRLREIDVKPWSQILFSSDRAAHSMVSGAFSKNSGTERGEQGDYPRAQSPRGNSCLLVGRDGLCVGGVRRTSSLYQLVSGFAMLLLGLLAGLTFPNAFPTGQPFKRSWLAFASACAIGSGLFAVAAITGEIWLFWL